MSTRYIVGYTADRRGAEAIALAASIGTGRNGPGDGRNGDGTGDHGYGSGRGGHGRDDHGDGLGNHAALHLDIAMILPEHTPFSAVYPGGNHGYGSILAEQVDTWAQGALELVPAGVSARVVVRSAPSEAEGLNALARETGAVLLVVGGNHGPFSSRLGPGSVASALLHSAVVPVALAPVGDTGTPDSPHGPSQQGLSQRGPSPQGLRRVTAFVGTRAGANAVVETAAAAARRRGAALRVVSLTDVDHGTAQGDADARRAELEGRISAVVRALGVEAETVIAQGETIEEAVQALEWGPAEVAVVGSSRLARKRRLFLGATAQRMLRTLTVPMIVVPKDYRAPAPTS